MNPTTNYLIFHLQSFMRIYGLRTTTIAHNKSKSKLNHIFCKGFLLNNDNRPKLIQFFHQGFILKASNTIIDSNTASDNVSIGVSSGISCGSTYILETEFGIHSELTDWHTIDQIPKSISPLVKFIVNFFVCTEFNSICNAAQ